MRCSTPGLVSRSSKLGYCNKFMTSEPSSFSNGSSPSARIFIASGSFGLFPFPRDRDIVSALGANAEGHSSFPFLCHGYGSSGEPNFWSRFPIQHEAEPSPPSNELGHDAGAARRTRPPSRPWSATPCPLRTSSRPRARGKMPIRTI
jgi:hypothetical protein